MRTLLVAGEPGGSVPAIREKLEQLWNAKVHDHSGSTEAGPWGFGTSAGTGLHVIESEYIAEFLSLTSGAAAKEGEEAELVITTLGRAGCPIIRYRTGDVVRPEVEPVGRQSFCDARRRRAGAQRRHVGGARRECVSLEHRPYFAQLSGSGGVSRDSVQSFRR